MKLLWLDLETTGLDPVRDTILEVAISVADLLTPFEATPLYHAVLCYPLHRAPYLLPVVREMHTRNGLLADCAASKLRRFEAEEQIVRLLDRIENKPDLPALAGSSVHFDASFLRQLMPLVAARVSHRHYDVSTLKLVARSMGMPILPKGEAHRARPDVDESIAHGRLCVDWLAGVRDR